MTCPAASGDSQLQPRVLRRHAAVEVPVRAEEVLPGNSSDLPSVVPAEAGIQGAAISPPHLDTRFRGYDGIGCTSCPTAPDFRAKPAEKHGGTV
jgi:hypothetical protein